MHLRQLIQSIM